MPLNTTNVFIKTACDALKNNMHKLNEEQREDLCDQLVKLCEHYAPGTFVSTEEKNDPYDHSNMD